MKLLLVLLLGFFVLFGWTRSDNFRIRALAPMQEQSSADNLVSSEKTGEAVKAFVVKNDPGLTEEDLISYCRKNLTAYKVPKLIEFRDELPKSNIGKVLRRMLREGEA